MAAWAGSGERRRQRWAGSGERRQQRWAGRPRGMALCQTVTPEGFRSQVDSPQPWGEQGGGGAC